MTIKTYTIVVYQAADGWRWRMKARNGRIVADSAEAYKKKLSAIEAGLILMEVMFALRVEDK